MFFVDLLHCIFLIDQVCVSNIGMLVTVGGADGITLLALCHF